MSIPHSTKYPEFVPDQLLTSEHLNNLFAYTDSEGRATRSRLVGIGVVCGLEVRLTGTSITITKGCGITSTGYLVRLGEDTTYTHSRQYDPLTEHAYDRFLNAVGNGPAFDLRQLTQAATTEDATPLTASGLQGKVVVMFVELLAEGAKNCDPSSCDDKGTTVTVSFLPMLVDASAAQTLMGNSAGGFSVNSANALPLMRMPRYDVPATPLVNAASVLNGFRKVLSSDFLKKMQDALSSTYSAFAPLVSDQYPNNPFSSLTSDFAEQYNDLDTATMLALQYHYDLFSDLMLAHDELRQVGEKLLAVCCPDEDLFPRHLVLGAVAGGGPRHNFQPSAALAGEERQVATLRLLFRRLVLLVERFFVPAPKQSGKKSKVLPIRITPSQWGTEPLSQRAIPFYYKVENPAPALFEHWNAERARTGRSNLTLSYHAEQYSSNNPVVTEPLNYDLEPFDFLRIEGHIGQKMPTALANILRQKAEKRLPFEVVALGADLRNVTRLIRSLIAEQREAAATASNITNGFRTNIKENSTLLNRAAATTLQSTANRTGLLGDCHVQDLEAIYDTLRAELECILCCEMQYFYGIKSRQQKENTFNNTAGVLGGGATTNAAAQQDLIPAVPLLKSCAPEFRYQTGTLGHMFELYWPALASKPYNSPDQGLEQIEALIAALEAQGNRSFNKDALGLWLALLLLYYIEKLWEILPASLSLLDAEAFATRYEDLMQVARAIKELINDDLTGESEGNNDDVPELFNTEDVIDHLDALIYACKDSAFEAVYREFLLRYMRALLRQKFGFFANQHPGIQHKAGVPVGGTFILVYHEAEIELEDEEEEAQTIFVNAQARREAFTSFFQNKKAQATGINKEARAEKVNAAGVPVTEKVGAAEQPTVVGLAKQTATYSKMLTEGDAKAMAFFEKYAAAIRQDEDEDTTLQDLLEELPDGTVIADFCLPYLCCSDCPPMQFVVRGGGEEEPEPEPEKPTLAIEQKDYCIDDTGEYPMIVTPEGGELKGEGVNAQKKTFRPSAVPLPAGSSSKDVTISYTTDGGAATRTVTVFAKPDASFKAEVSAASPLAYIFQDTSTNAQSWEWNFGDGQTSTEQSPQHTYKERREFIVTLTITNGPCRDETKQEIVIGKPTEEPPQQAACAPLADIIADFESFEKAIGRTGAKFIDAFESYGDVVALFKQILPELEEKDTKDQSSRFAEDSTATKLAEWMEELQNQLILEGAHRSIALALYRLLLRLLLYIVCIQGRDLSKAPELEAALKVVAEHVRKWGQLTLSTADKKQVQTIAGDIDEERARAKARGGKPEYEKALADILNELKA